MNDIQWIKLKTAMFGDDKIRLIESMPEADSILIIWIKLLIQAGKTNANGYIFLNENVPLSPEMISTLFSRPLSVVKLALKTLSDFGMISINPDGFISIENWEKHQNVEGMERVRELTKARVQRHRDKQKQLTESVTLRNVTVTEQNKTQNKNEEYLNTIFDHWNKCNVIQHRKLTDKIRRKINSSLKDYSIDEIKSAIDNYKLILESPLYYFNYKWTLNDFLQRGLEKFLDLETAKNNYKKETIQNNGHKSKEAVTELVI